MHRNQLHVVTAYQNFRRLPIRLKLLEEWVPHMLDSGVSLTIVELGLGQRPFDIDPARYPQVNVLHVRGSSEHEIWMRDGLINYAFARLPDAEYLCWEDADIRHVRGDWATETLHMLQHCRVGQTWTHSADLDTEHNVSKNEWGNEMDRSFCAAWLAGDVEIPAENYAPDVSRALLAHKTPQDWRSHTGYSWAIRRDALNSMGRLLDWMVTGSSDYHMALAFCGKLRQMVETELGRGGADRYSPGYYRRLREYAVRVDDAIRQDIGVVPGLVLHGWHGSKQSRLYGARDQILRESRFDPDTDVAYDIHGLPRLSSDNRLLRDGLRRYATLRDNAGRLPDLGGSAP